MGSSSPQSQESQSFEAYNRRVLPQLVEASLSAAISTDLAPVEERVRALVGDILRTCQSTVFRNFQRMSAINSPKPDATASPTPFFSHPVSTNERENAFASVFYQEPPHLNSDEGITTFEFTSENNVPIPAKSQISDSGYESPSKGCECSCHQAPSNLSSLPSTYNQVGSEDTTLNESVETQGCINCTLKHPDYGQISQEGKDDTFSGDVDFEQWLFSEESL